MNTTKLLSVSQKLLSTKYSHSIQIHCSLKPCLFHLNLVPNENSKLSLPNTIEGLSDINIKVSKAIEVAHCHTGIDKSNLCLCFSTIPLHYSEDGS